MQQMDREPEGGGKKNMALKAKVSWVYGSRGTLARGEVGEGGQLTYFMEIYFVFYGLLRFL